MSDRERVRAATSGQQGWGWHGSATTHQRYAELLPGRYRNRRRCACRCGGKASHVGMANGVALTSGCELSIRRWTRNPMDFPGAGR